MQNVLTSFRWLQWTSKAFMRLLLFYDTRFVYVYEGSRGEMYHYTKQQCTNAQRCCAAFNELNEPWITSSAVWWGTECCSQRWRKVRSGEDNRTRLNGKAGRCVITWHPSVTLNQFYQRAIIKKITDLLYSTNLETHKSEAHSSHVSVWTPDFGVCRNLTVQSQAYVDVLGFIFTKILPTNSYIPDSTL